MECCLLDVNVLLSLFDPAHLHHDSAHAWFAGQRRHGWASCPITENGFVRIISNPRYPTVKTNVHEARRRLREFTAAPEHRFWEDSFSILDEGILRDDLFMGPGQITDAYLMALALKHGGKLATFDQRLSSDWLCGNPDAVLLIQGKK